MSDPRDEKEANAFAMAILMPEAWLRRDCPSPISVMNTPIIEMLAERYGVEPIIMALRLQELRLIA